MARSRQQVEYGDWQTPAELTERALARCLASGFEPRTVVEPTCGVGRFLLSAARVFPGATLVGSDINAEYCAEATSALRDAGARASIAREDFFAVDWNRRARAWESPVLVVGNPPWVTSAELGRMAGTNLPRKANFKGLSGLDARTGKSNFDVSEWMVIHLIEALRGGDFRVAILCKAAVARRVMEYGATAGWKIAGAVFRIDAQRYFGASVHAVWMEIWPVLAEQERARGWEIHDSLTSTAPTRHMGVVGGRTYSDLDAYERTRELEGDADPEWRSGVKHDCARVMEFDVVAGGLRNGLGELVEIEPDCVYPLLKGADVAHGRAPGRKMVLLPQRRMGDDPRSIAERCPRTWDYLETHAELLAARKSSVYRHRPPYSVFGVGDYTFTPFKVAVSGLYRRFAFSLVEPHQGRPVVCDDTVYFVPFARRARAVRVHQALQHPRVERFFAARVFWDAKRPISKGLLQGLDLGRLVDGA